MTYLPTYATVRHARALRWFIVTCTMEANFRGSLCCLTGQASMAGMADEPTVAGEEPAGGRADESKKYAAPR